MKKIDSVAAAMADLTHKIITDIHARGYSPSDAETLAVVRENIKALKDFDIEPEAEVAPAEAPAEAPVEAAAKSKAGD